MEVITITDNFGIASLKAEIDGYLKQLDVSIDGDHLWSNYEAVIAVIMRLNEIHNNLAYIELMGQASPEQKKFRTMIVDPTIERLEKVAAFESRKITAKNIEANLEKA